MPAIRALLSHVFPLVFGGTRTGGSGAASPYPFRSDKSSQSAPASVGKIKAQRYSKYGHSTEITVQNEWTVMGNPANRSDVELVAMEKKLPFRSGTGYVGDRPPDSDQWSGGSGGTVNLPIQGGLKHSP
jgi:hypothetical protein